ncbi:MAG: PhoU domain-containing protein, partial [Eubacteriales bacterium]|nr:PhoU domain-containing protein [Eubacteriales bacterium]
DGKRTVLVHFLFNMTGTILFMIVCKFLPFVEWVEALTPGNPVAQIANANTIFNVVTTMVLLPCAGILIRIANKLIPGTDEETGPQLMHINDRCFAAASIAIGQVDAEVGRMQALARKNLHAALDTLTGRASESLETIHNNEEIIDFLNKEITRVLVRINAMELTHADAQRMSGMYHVLSDIERIGDHAENIAGYAAMCREKQQRFSSHAIEEMQGLGDMVYDMMDQSYKHFIEPWDGKLEEIYDLEEHIDETVDALNAHHIERLNEHRCTPDLGMIYVEVLTDLERVADHALNIAQAAPVAKS